MNDEDAKKSIDALDSLSQEFASSPAAALDFFVSEGFLTPDGDLTEHYRQSA